jgi:hypothetical protein
MGSTRRLPDFGQVDLDLDDDAVPNASTEETPTRRSYVAPRRPEHDETIDRAALDAATRVVFGDALANVTRSQPPPPRSPSASSERTIVPAPPPPAPRRISSVAALRELYVRGNVEEALAVASDVAAEAERIDFGDRRGMVEETAPPTAIGENPLAQLLSKTGVPRILRPLSELAHLPIDHRAGFLLAHVDGRQTMEEILDVCAMPEAEALAVIDRLRKMGVLEID